MDYASDIALCNYFEKNSEKIKSWFNIISPKGKTITDLKKDLLVLSKKIGRRCTRNEKKFY